MSDKLKPCPFCGGIAEVHCWHNPATMGKDEIRVEVQCNDCYATVGGYYGANFSIVATKEDAIGAWNRRVSDEH